MKLNCRPGDLAVIVRSTAGNEGTIVHCVRLEPQPWWAIIEGPRWLIESPVPDTYGMPIRSVADFALRPLRDSDGEDEVLRLVGSPVGEPEAA